ncbi:hypothetical protein OB69_09165 [Roseivirga seohaensis subsp. aquiponti]|uniref:Uncharacterized protein n=1 Tax=Roseivirga seohaensis subsp. aquiponti TaxID=1566026 RepID=A0A0L8ALD5_9BACT|nr:hypothetical protein OB69_09165 [Roseivirga seohaensis subsp. aquiponti]
MAGLLTFLVCCAFPFQILKQWQSATHFFVGLQQLGLSGIYTRFPFNSENRSFQETLAVAQM